MWASCCDGLATENWSISYERFPGHIVPVKRRWHHRAVAKLTVRRSTLRVTATMIWTPPIVAWYSQETGRSDGGSKIYGNSCIEGWHNIAFVPRRWDGPSIAGCALLEAARCPASCILSALPGPILPLESSIIHHRSSMQDHTVPLPWDECARISLEKMVCTRGGNAVTPCPDRNKKISHVGHRGKTGRGRRWAINRPGDISSPRAAWARPSAPTSP